jgi:hypothetical protein
MMPQAFGVLNGLVPVAGLMALAVLLPMPLARFIGDDQRRLALIMVASLADLAVAGALVLWLVTRAEDPLAAEAPLVFLARSVKMALAWGPVWALVWLVRAQGIERRRGLRMGQESQDDRDT